MSVGFPGGSVVKNLLANAGDASSIPELDRSSGGGNANPLQNSCLENPMDRGAWWDTVHGVTKSWTWLSDWTHTHTHTDVSDLLSFLKDILTGYSVLNQLIFSFSTSKMFYCLVVSIASDEKLVIIDTVPLNVICPPPHIDCLKMFLFLFGFLKFDYNVPHPVWDSFRFSYVDWHISLVFEKFHLLSLNVFPPHSVFFWASIHIYWTDSVPRCSCFL